MAVTSFPSDSRASVESVKQTVRSASTCSAATVLSLQTLFRGPNPADIESATAKKVGGGTKTTITHTTTATTTASRAKTARTRPTKTKPTVRETALGTLADNGAGRLSNQEKLVLATEVFNTTLKTLSDAAKTATSTAKATSPVKRGAKSNRSKMDPAETTEIDDGVSAVGECARLSLSCLRTLKSETGGEQGDGLPNMQLEQGACVLAGRLLALGLHDATYKELRGLKRRIQQYLDGLTTGKKRTTKNDTQGEVEEAAKERMSDLLSFSNILNARSVHGLLVSFQSNALRLITAEKRPATVHRLVPSLQLTDESSPANVISAALESGAISKEKAAVQLQLLSSTVSSLSSQSNSATKDRLKPTTVLTLQLLSLEIRCMSWKISGHICQDSKEMWDPLARYVGAFAQATKSIEKAEFALIYKSIVRLQSIFAKTQNRVLTSAKDNLSVARIAIILGQLAQDAGCFNEALQLFTESITPLSSGQCLGLATVRCKIATLHFQAIKSSKDLKGDLSDILTEATNALSLPLKGSTHDLDELLVEAAKLKKLSMGWFGDHVSKDQDKPENDNDVFPRVYGYLTGFVRFLRRYIGRRPTDDETQLETFQKRIDDSQNIVLAAVDSTVAIGRLSVMSQRPPWDEIVSTLLDCQRLLTTIEPSDGDLATTDATDMALVKLSNLFWSRYLKEKEAGKGARQLLPLLKQSTNLLSGCSPTHRMTGFAPLKYERLAHTYVEGGMISEGEVAFCQSISDHIAIGALDNIISSTDGLFPHQISQDPKQNGFTLGRVLSAYLKVKLRSKRSAVDEVFDDDTLPSVQRGHILEWQLGILTEVQGAAHSDQVFRAVFSEVVSKLLDVYAIAQHPVRRLRVVLCGLRFTLEQPGSLDPALLQRFIREGTAGMESDEYQYDTDIASLATHLRDSVRLTLGLHQGSLGPEQLTSIISSWTSMLRSCHDLKSLTNSVGNVDYYLLQMKAVVDYTEIHGLWKLQLSTLELILRATELQGTGISEGIMVLSRLVLQYCRLGNCTKASSLLSRAEGYVAKHEVSCLAKLSYNLAQVGFFLETGDIQKAGSILSAARMLYEKNQSMEDLNACSVLTKISWERLVADAAFMSSRLSFAQGSIKDALYFAKLSVRLNCRIWAKVEKLAQKKQEKAITSDSSELEIVVDGMAKLEVARTSTYSQGAPFWPHIGSHHSSLLHLANLSAHHGLFQDAIYYGEQAMKINKSLNANVRLIASQAQLGSHWILGGHISEGQELLNSAKEHSGQLESSIELVSLQMSLAALQRVEGDFRGEYRILRGAEKLVSGLFQVGPAKDSVEVGDLEEEMDKLRIQPKRRPTRQTAATATRRTRSATTAQSTTTSAPSTPKPPPSAESTPVDSNSLLHVKSDILRQQAASLRAQREFDKASNLLTDARKFAVTRDSKISVHLGESEHLLADAIRNFAGHAVYCVLPESTISLPSLQPSSAVTEASSGKSTSRRTRAPTRGTRAKAQPAVEDFSVMLSKAGNCLNDIFHTATSLGSTLDSHSASRLMSRISMLTHATASQNQATPLQSPATMNEIGRIGAFARERAAISIDKQLTDYCDALLWPRSEAIESDDSGSDFTQDYVDILPDNWNVLSLSLSADQTEFVVSRLHQGRSPFLLRLPLRRGNSEDEEEQFTFDDGRDEMKELIRLANESAHAAKLQIDRQAKKEWWKNREALDRRMENLLQKIENVWFGGFRGIFSPIPHSDNCLARFASSFESVLDKHLPSRQKGARSVGPKLTLHPNVLELFVGVKDLDEQEDPEDTLMDLLYFVVDILQFQGERNAYDEVDFDMMVVETIDAVRAYHEAASNEAQQRPRPNNTVLVLDKSLHLFPWESLPCLQGLPVCRVPSLECLRDRVLQFRSQKKPGLGLDRRNGAYILNPTGDLQTTQGTFENELSRLQGWTGVVNRQPSEEEFKDALESKSLFLYFGHGSGAQYIRGRTVKRLDQCAVTFLMGCSSGTLTEAGEYEPYGTPMNYLQAGSPALVATLWDVTDKDIDRFAKATFENWGLVPAGSRACGEGVGDDAVALDAAVSQSRRACVLKYLNGAAPVVYGVPGVFLE
ncbi:C50 family peptidase [Aspergillus undulatus]|uniref:C50 family peptidase n=1 Tax=Aspergillus undulatus TaxID=1810928 RepID=UPI003CCCD843